MILFGHFVILIMHSSIPVYSIQKFQPSNTEDDFYANNLSEHVAEHHFTHLPHKHDFYLVVLFTKGSGRHEVDFETYSVKPGSLFILKPGQMHYWDLSKDVDGYVFFHSKNFYDSGFQLNSIRDFQFYNSFQSPPIIQLSKDSIAGIKTNMARLVEEHQAENQLKWMMIHSLINIVYVLVAREYNPSQKVKNETYLRTVLKFEDLIEENFKELKFAKDYAQRLHISEKHLNRITQTCLSKTSTQLISERVVLEAKRKLIYSQSNVMQIGEELGFKESTYFIRFFKKYTGMTPLVFLNQYNQH